MRVLLVPGGGSSIEGYFGEIAAALRAEVGVLESDPPGLDVSTGRRWLRLPDHARWLARVVREEDDGRVVVVGHSLGGLVALRLALDEPELVAGLLLLDPSPPLAAVLVPTPLLRVIGRLRRHRMRRHAPLPAPRAVPLRVRIRWIFVEGGIALAADIAAGGIARVPTVVVSAAEHASSSLVARSHRGLAALIPNATLEVWPETTHELHTEEPHKVVQATLRLVPDAGT